MWLAGRMRHPPLCAGRLLLSSLRLFSPAAAAERGDAPASPGRPTHFMVDYLVGSCGLSSVQALKASRSLTHLKSTVKPDAVLRLLRQAGLGDDEIGVAVRKYPGTLVLDPEKTLEPKIKELQVAGFSGCEVAQLISLNPSIVYIRDLLDRLEFWKKVLGTKESVLKAVKREPRLLGFRLNGKIIPRISLFRDLGISDDRVAKLIVRNPRWVLVKSGWIKSTVEQVKALGFTPGSRMFAHALFFIGSLSSSTFEAKSKVLRSYGWIQPELMSAIHRFPAILNYSEKRIRATMDFLLNEAGCVPSFIARKPLLVGLSMEKRLIPRNNVLQCLKKRGLLPKMRDLWEAMHMDDGKFIEKFVMPYRDQLPELLEACHVILSSQATTKIDGS